MPTPHQLIELLKEINP